MDTKRLKEIPTLSNKDINRFWSKVDIRDFGSCWSWKGPRNQSGYGNIKIKSQNYQAHRISFTITKNNIDKSLICHICDNPSCVNPYHLFECTQKQNVADCKRKGRMVNCHRKRIHPSYGAYKNRGCRCIECVEIYRKFERERRRRHRAKVSI